MDNETAKTVNIVDTVEALEARMAEMRKAQAVFATYTQEQVDKIFKAAATAADKARIPLAKMAAEETGMGLVEDKVIKNHYAAEYIYNFPQHKDMRRHRGGPGLRHQEDRRADRPYRGCHPYNKPDINSDL